MPSQSVTHGRVWWWAQNWAQWAQQLQAAQITFSGDTPPMKNGEPSAYALAEGGGQKGWSVRV
jgi:hypothetical protein